MTSKPKPSLSRTRGGNVAVSTQTPDWIWMPHAAHFVGASSCEFRLATYVNGYIVSTVGEYIPRGSYEVQNIGWNRKYETMVFKSRKSKEPGHCEACPYFIDDAVDRQP
jgi:hypothetical protein